MSLATIERIDSVWAHPNADALDMARVLGYECIVRRGAYVAGDMIVFIQPDSILPADREWAAEVLKYTKTGGRVRAARLRGEWSMGLVMPLSIFPSEDLALGRFDVGAEVSERLGVTAYEAPLPKDLKAKGGLPFGMPKTDENRWQNIRDLDQFLGEPVDVTLKIDGSSFTAYCVLPGDHPGDEPLLGITSRTLELKMIDDATNQWLEAERFTGVLDKLLIYCRHHGVSLALRGEIYGKGIQSMQINPHCRKERGIGFFSVWDIRQHEYLGRNSPHYFPRLCLNMGLPMVPFLEEDVPLTRELLRKYDSELATIAGEPFEGVVIKGASFSLKVMNKHYDSKK